MGVRLTIAPTQSSAHASGNAVDRDAPWEFDQARIVLGRGSASDVVLPDVSVSTRHATIEADGVRYTIVDHGSLNGTRVNGTRIVAERKKPLRDGDVVELGLFRAVFTANVAVRNAPSRERTATLARKLLQSVRAQGSPTSTQRLLFLHGPEAGQAIALPEAPARMLIGRSEEAEVRLSDADASREHAELEVTFEGVTLVDLGSKNGLSVNSERTSRRRLLDRDEITIGSTVLAFESDLEPSWKALEHLPEVRMPEPPAAPMPPSLPPALEESAEDKVSEEAPASTAKPDDEPPATDSEVTEADSAMSRVPTVEWVVYGLALLVFAASAAGLAWLLRIV